MDSQSMSDVRNLSSALHSLSPNTSNLGAFRKGTIVSVQSGTPDTCTIQLSGDTTDIPGVYFLDSYNPTVADVVVLGKQAGSLLILGSVNSANPISGGGGGGGDVVGSTRYARKSSITSRSSANTGTTLTNDPNLTMSVSANAEYEVVFVVFCQVSAVTNNQNPGFKTAWSVPASTSGLKVCLGSANTATAPGYNNSANTALQVAGLAFTTTVNYPVNPANTNHTVIERAYLATSGTSGNVVLQWAQQTSNANNTSVDAWSYMKVTRVA